MPLTIYLDDSFDWDLLIAFLSQAGHTVVSPRQVGMSSRKDSEHLKFAARYGHVLLTRNPQDFISLHHDWQAQGRTHSGLLLVYYDNIAGKDMTPRDIVRAIENLLASGLPIVNQIHILNQWR